MRHPTDTRPACIRCCAAILISHAYRLAGTTLHYCVTCRYDFPNAATFVQVTLTRGGAR